MDSGGTQSGKVLKNSDITDLINFVDDAATKYNDPVYGRLNESPTEEGMVDLMLPRQGALISTSL